MSTIRFEQVSKMFRQRHANAPDGELWALRDVNFECQEGEVLGLIGRNGCGKSTLLKLAANVTFPTLGKVDCVRPVAPMLELGAGFHQDLTGRDNIQLNGSLLGLGRNISASLLDEIVEFAELAPHIDTPVKHYSSGMYARLGFAVAVHSPARLLLVDEVLAVGDKLFQQKCLARMKFLRDRGTTILLVSHDSWWIRNFCSRALLLDGGRIVADGAPEEALDAYDARLRGAAGGLKGSGSITRVEVCSSGSSVRVRAAYDAGAVNATGLLVARVRSEDGVYCASCASASPIGSQTGVAIIEIEDLHLSPGQYIVEISMEESAWRSPVRTQASRTFVVAPDEGARASGRRDEAMAKVRHHWSFE